MTLNIRRTWRKLSIYTLSASVLFACALTILPSRPAIAATGTNSQINFQGRLLNGQGAVVPDGFYNIEFNIYQDGDGQTAGDTSGSPAGTLKWTEDYLNSASQGVEVKNGFLSVQLGSITPFGNSVNWNTDTLWLSMNVAGTSTTCSPFASCSPDGEMLPMKRLSATPYALNSNYLSGLSSAQFLQLAQGIQTDSSANSSIAVNKTALSGNILELQKAGVDVLSVDNTGNLLLGQQGNGGQNGKIVFNTTNASNTAITIQAASTTSSYALTLPTNSPLTGQCLQTDSLDNTQLVFGACGATGTFLSKNATDTSSADAGSGYLYAFTNNGSGGTGGVLNLNNSNNTGTVLNVKGGSANAFQVQNNSSNRVFGVDTAGNHTVLGQSSAVDGSLVFNNHTSANAITINSTAANSNYILTLPSSAPATGLCIETSAGDASQLVFASCTNNNASIQEVAEWDANNANTIAISPTTVGDEIILTTQIPTSGITVTGVSGGGVANWNKVVVSAGNGTVNRVEMWVGTATSIGSSTITVTYSSAPGANEITATEFTAAGVNASTSWGIESSASLLNNTASTTVTYPNRTAVNGSELYVGYAQVQNPPATSGTTTGFNYITTSTQHNIITYNTDLAANTSYQPTANQNSVGESNAVAVVLTAFVTSTSINNTTSLQQANFYVQAATSGSVAGVLQAASSGNADIFDLRNSAGTNVLTVNPTGNLTLSPAASTTALQVQNGNSHGILTVDTQNNRVVLGSPNSVAGILTFSDVSDNNTVSLSAPTSVAASYTLTLPANTPTGGLCLGTDPSNANQLIFASCATQVSAASINYVNTWSSSGTSITTVADSPTSKGNLVVLYSHAANNVGITSISGGGVTNWTKVTSNINVTGQGNNEMWRGVVTAIGASTITVNYSSAAGANEIAAQEFTMGSSSGTWAIDTSGAAINSGSQTTINYPNLTPANSSELYAGYAWSQNTMVSGTTTGFTYLLTNSGKYVVYDTSVTGGTSVQPTASQSTAGNYNSIAAVIAAYAGTSVIVNSTATQQANFNVQAATSDTVAGVVQGASSGNADIFEAKDGNGNNIAAINAASGLTLGMSNIVGGQLNFAAPNNSNIITLKSPDAPGASYGLVLPTTTPAPGQCLASSPSNANQLVFSSCANQVTSIAISFVNGWNNTVNGNNMTLSVSPTNVGDLMVLFVAPQKSNTVSSVSGGGVSTWSKITSTISGTGMEMWRGVVTSSGSSTISATLTGATGNNDIAAYEFTTGSATGSWVVDTSNTQANPSSTTVTYPNLTPQSTKDLYIGYARAGGTMSAGSTSGFIYTTGGYASDMGTYNTSVSTTIAPTATQSSSSASVTAGALIAAYSSSSVISNSTNTQEANFNVQAATPGSVAGVLQAAVSGTQDVLQIMDASGSVVDSFGSTGNMLVRPSTASAAAFQVQNTSNVNVLSADTINRLVVIGAGSTGESSPSLLVIDSETGTSADPSVLNGAMYYNATTHTFRCGVDGSWQNCNSLLYANTSASGTSSNCSNNCAAFTTTATIPANYCQAGRVIKLYASGYFSSQSTPSNLQLGVYYGTDSSTAANDTLLGSLTPASTVTSATNNYFQMNFNITCFSTTTMQTGGALNIQTGTSSSGLLTLPMGSNSGTTVVSSSAKNIYIFPIWDTASLSNTAKLSQLNVNTY